MNVELYSLKGFTGSALKARIESAIANQNLFYKVVEYHEVDDFIRAGLPSVPAVKIGNQVIRMNDNVPFDDFVEKAIDVMTGRTEKFILVPVDFSASSINALRYALLLASRIGTGIKVLHVHEPLADPISGMAMDELMRQQEKIKLENILLELGWQKQKSGLHVPLEIDFQDGDIVHYIRKASENDNAVMIVMGSRPEESLWKKYFGSVSTKVGRHARKPVIILPSNTKTTFPLKMVVALPESLYHHESFDFLFSFGSANKIFLDFIYATDDEHKFREIKKRLLEKIEQHKCELCGFNILPFGGQGKIGKLLLDYAQKVNADMIAVEAGHYKFPESVFHHSVSKEVMDLPQLPVMVLHRN